MSFISTGLKELLGSHFQLVSVLGQGIYCNSNIWPLFPPSGRIAEYVIEKGAPIDSISSQTQTAHQPILLGSLRMSKKQLAAWESSS
jgi:hypothetical protein